MKRDYAMIISMSCVESSCLFKFVPSHTGAPDSMYYNGSLYIDDSSVKMRWNFQNQMNAIQIYFSSNCTNTAAMAWSECVSNYPVAVWIARYSGIITTESLS